MGSARDKFRDFAIAFWKTSKKDPTSDNTSYPK